MRFFSGRRGAVFPVAALITPPAGGGGVTALAFQASATSSSTAGITCPTTVAGDIIVLMDFTEATSGSPTLVTPSGFTAIASGDNTGTRGMVTSRKKADGTEGGTTIVGCANLRADKILATFRPTGSLTTITAGSVNSQYPAAGAPSNQTVTAGTAPLVVLGFYGNTIGTRGFSTTADAEITANVNYQLFLDYKIYNASPASTTISLSAAGAMHSCYLAAS